MRSSRTAGRDAELAELGSLLDEATSGRARLVLIGGDAGVGKSRLLTELIDVAHSTDVWTLVGRCIDLGEGSVPFAPFLQVFDAVAQEVDRTQLPEVLGSARWELARLVPDLAEGRRDVAHRDAGEERGRLFGAVVNALRRLAEERGPLLVGIEDVHWARTSTLDLLGFLARNLTTERLLVVITYRTDELHRRHPLRPVVGELSRLRGVRRLELEPLDEEEVGQQVRAILGRDPEPGVVSQIAERSGGNPFYVEELVAASREGRPHQLRPALRDVVASRLDALPDPVHDLLDVVAVAGSSVDHRLLGAVTGHQPADLARLLRPAVDQHVLVVDGDAYEFRHELVREVVADELLPGHRIELHRSVARTLQEHPELATGGPEHADAELAHHWQAAHETQEAFSTSIRAARRARETAAFAEALEHHERALALWDRVDHGDLSRIELLQHAAEAANAAGRYTRAIAHLRAALDDTRDDPEQEADLRRRLATALWSSIGGPDAALREAERAHALVADREPSRTSAAVVGTHARLLMLDRQQGALDVGREALDLARAIDDRSGESHALSTLGVSLALAGDVDGAVDRLHTALLIARDAEDDAATTRAFNNLVILLRDNARFLQSEIEGIADEAFEWLRERDRAARGKGVLSAALATDATLRGHWDKAEEILDWAARHHLEGQDDALFHDARGRLRWMQGRTDEAARHAQRLHDLADQHPYYAGVAFTLDAVLAAADGRLGDVREAVAAGDQVVFLRGHANDPVVMALGLHRPLVRAEVDAALGAKDPTGSEHLERATEVLAGMHDLFEEDPPSAPGVHHRAETYLQLAEAELSRVTGPDPDRWRAVLERAEYPYWQVYARWRLAEALLETDRREDAAVELEAAHEQATDLGAAQLRDDIEVLARRARIRLPGVEITDPAVLGLTPRETEVLDLVAEGRTNRNIGEMLYITEKTVSVHVSNILSKLDVDNRREAARRARELGLVDAGHEA